MCNIEIGYHKLNSPNDAQSVLINGLDSSRPAERHWLGEGIYFFLDPNGQKWAIKWPMNPCKPRTNSREGILTAQIDTGYALDLRKSATMTFVIQSLEVITKKISEHRKSYSDGAFFKFYLNYLDLIGVKYTAIIANFDDDLGQYRINPTRAFLNLPKDFTYFNCEKTQIQACVVNKSVIQNLKVFES